MGIIGIPKMGKLQKYEVLLEIHKSKVMKIVAIFWNSQNWSIDQIYHIIGISEICILYE